MKLPKFSSTFYILIIAEIFTSILVILYFNFPVPKITSPVTYPTPTPISWKTYKNDQYGFEFQYPNSMSENSPFDITDDSGIQIQVGGKWDQNAFTECMRVTKKEKVFISKIPFEKTTYINDKSAFGGVCSEVDESKYSAILFPLDEKTMFNFVLHFNKENQKQALNYLNQILSTFKFTKP